MKSSVTSVQPHQVVCIALPGVICFDLATACEAFEAANLGQEVPRYHVTVCAEQQELDAGPFALRIRQGLSALNKAHTIVIPGIRHPNASLSSKVTKALRSAAARGARIASICSGAFALAQTGLLDGLSATTHWLAAEELQRRFPHVRVDPKALYVDNGQILTSAGAAAGLDLCLHMIRKDFGASVAAHVARLSVVPLQREGGQAQFIEPRRTSPDKSLQPLLAWALAHLDRPLSIKDLTAQSSTSERTLHRRFRDQFGTSPAQWLLRSRVNRAQELLEASSLTVEQIVSEVGLESAANFRAQFQRVAGVSPNAYRKSFGVRVSR